MNEGKQKLEALRKMLKKKNNHPSSQQTIRHNTAQPNGNTEEQVSNHKILIEQGVSKTEKMAEQHHNIQTQKITVSISKKQQQKANSLTFNVNKNKQPQQALEQGQIQEEQEHKINEQEKIQQNSHILHQNIDKQKDQAVNDDLIPKNLHKGVEQIQHEQGQLPIEENKQKENQEVIIEEKIDNIMDEGPKQSHQHSLPNEQQNQKSPKQSILQNIKSITQQVSDNKPKQVSKEDLKQQKQNKQKNLQNNESLQQTQSLSLNPTHSHQNHSSHLSEHKNPHHIVPTKPAIKVVLKQLQMIKTSIHNLTVTHRGIEYLRQKVKQDPILKRKIKQRLLDLQEDNQVDVLRKLVKKVHTQYITSSQGQNNLNSLQGQKNNSASLIQPLSNNQSLGTQKIVSQPQIPISNQAIEY